LNPYVNASRTEVCASNLNFNIIYSTYMTWEQFCPVWKFKIDED